MTNAISGGQLKRLQVLYGQLCGHTHQEVDRTSRLAWASQATGREISSFKDLSQDEAKQLIDTLQGQLGVPQTQRPRRRPGRKRLNADDARKAGTEGRRGFESNEKTMAGAAEFARIQYALDQIGWSQQQLEAWLRSPRSPLGKSNPQIRTLGDANRVWWALKRMLDARRNGGSR